jgi:hypothetical protein
VSGAAEVELVHGKRELLVVSDSGNAGAAMAYDLTTRTFRKLALPLDAAASDDIEGIAWRAGALYTITSSGAVRAFHPDRSGALAASGASYRLGPAPSWSCENLGEVNCGKNWEGLCLRASRPSGWVASKQENALYPVTLDAKGRLNLDASSSVPLRLELERHALSDCTFGPKDRLLVTTNVYGGAATYVVDEASAAAGHPAALVRVADAPGTMSNEAISVDHDGALYQFQDDNGPVSAALRATCSW